jgi:hypothetical protein
MAQIFHPDRFAGSPENVRTEAERRMKKLNQAYSLARTGSPAPVSSSPTAATDPRERAAQAARTQQRSRATRSAAREHQARLRAARAARMQAEKTASEARARPKGSRADRRSVLAGMGKALRTNELTCRGCRGIQRLPSGWQSRLDDTEYFCSVCGRLLLARGG